MHNCCDDYTRSQLLRSAAAEAGKGLPAIEPGMPEPAGTGLSRRTLPLAQRRPGAGRLRRLEDPARRLRGRASPRRRRPTRSSSRSSSTAASTRSACWPRSATRATRSCGRTWRSRPTRAPNSPRTRGCAGTPRPPGLATLHDEGKVSAFPAIGYDHPDQSHFTSRHYYEIGELDVGFHTGWLGRYLDQVGDDDNPLQGLSMDGSLSPMIATARTAGGGDRQRRRLRPLVAGRRPDLRRDVQELRPLRLAALGLPGAGAGPPRDRPDRQAAHRPRRDRRLHQPGHLPRQPTSPTSSPGSPPSSPPGCRCGW